MTKLAATNQKPYPEGRVSDIVRRILLLLVGVVSGVFLFFPKGAAAQYDIIGILPATLSNLDIQISIQEKAAAQVTESFTAQQAGGQGFSFVIPGEGVHKLSVLNGGQIYSGFTLRHVGKVMIIDNLSSAGSFWQVKYKLKNIVQGKSDFDEFRFEVIPSGNYIGSLKMTVRLPASVKNTSRLKVIHYAIHGVDFSESSVLSPSLLEYRGQNLGPYSSFAAVAEIPKGIIKFSPFQKLENFVRNLSVLSWVAVSLALPFVTFLIMIFMIYQKRKGENIQPLKEVVTAPPQNISPAVVGVLASGGLGAREIAATIIDMAVRGYLFVVNGGIKEGYRFGERRSFLALAPHERDLGKELLRGGLRRTVKEIGEAPQAQIFSATVSLIYQDIYRDVARLGYFLEDPERVHLRYYFAGMAIFLASIIGFILAAIFLPYPPYPLFGFFAMAISSLVVMRTSARMPVRTEQGKQALAQWLAFRNYLVNYPQAGYREVMQETFFKWLPYAVALGVEKKWARHFVNAPFRNPEWYAAFQEFTSLSQFTQSFYPIIDYLADIMESLKEPTVK